MRDNSRRRNSFILITAVTQVVTFFTNKFTVFTSNNLMRYDRIVVANDDIIMEATMKIVRDRPLPDDDEEDEVPDGPTEEMPAYTQTAANRLECALAGCPIEGTPPALEVAKRIADILAGLFIPAGSRRIVVGVGCLPVKRHICLGEDHHAGRR